MYQSTALFYEPIRSVNTSALSGSYVVLGTALTDEARILKIVNNSNQDLTISTNGTTDMDFLPQTSFVLYDAGSNRGNPAPTMVFPKGTQFYVKGSAGTGLVYLVVLYGNTPTQNFFS